MRCVRGVCVELLTQAVPRAYVDLKDGHAAPCTLSRFAFDDDLISNTCLVPPPGHEGEWRHRRGALKRNESQRRSREVRVCVWHVCCTYCVFVKTWKPPGPGPTSGWHGSVTPVHLMTPDEFQYDSHSSELRFGLHQPLRKASDSPTLAAALSVWCLAGKVK